MAAPPVNAFRPFWADPIVTNDSPQERANRREELLSMPDVEEMLDLKSPL